MAKFSYLLILLLLISLLSSSFGTEDYPSASSLCGTYGPTRWVNDHISNIILAGTGAPFSNRVASFPRFFDFFGGENFPGVFGCSPSKLSHYSDDSASLRFHETHPLLVTSMTVPQQSQEEKNEVDTSSFGTLSVEYQDCRPTTPQKYFGEQGVVVKSYRQINPSYPDGAVVFFFYDESCRVQSLELKTFSPSGVPTTIYSSNFTYQDFPGSVSWLPSSVKSSSEIATTLLTFDFHEGSPDGPITKFTSTKLSAQLESELALSVPRIEEWELFYSPSKFLLERAQLVQRSILGKTSTTYFFEHDGLGRWTKVSSTPGLVEGHRRTNAPSAIRAFYQDDKMTRLQMFKGLGSRLHLEYEKLETTDDH